MFKRFLVTILMVSIMAGLVGVVEPQVAQAAVTLSVDTKTVIQPNFLGTNAVYHGFSYMPENAARGMTEALRTWEFDTVANGGLRIARTWYRPDWACGYNWNDTYDWNSTKMTAFYNWLQQMKNRNIDVALNAGWWFTNDTYNGYLPSPEYGRMNSANDKQKFARWLSQSLYQIITVRGFTNVKYVHLFTEPLNYPSGVLPTGITEWDYYKDVCNTINNQLIADGRRNLVKLVGPNTTLAPAKVADCASQLNNVIDIYASHDYSKAGYDAWYNMAMDIKNACSSTGKPYWVDEFGKQDTLYRDTADYGTYLGEAVAAFINAGAENCLLWTLCDQVYESPLNHVSNADSFYDGIHKWGSLKSPIETKVPRYSWYAYSLVGKYMSGGMGTAAYKTTNLGGVYIAATKRSNGDWSFLVVNSNTTSQDVTVSLNSNINKTLYRYLYNPATVKATAEAAPIGYDTTILNVANSFTSTIPARSVAVFSSIKGSPYVEPSPTPAPTPTPTVAKAWEFNADGNNEGWTAAYGITGLQTGGGSLWGTVTATDAYMVSSDNLNVNSIENYRFIEIKTNNSVPTGSIGRIYWTTTADPEWSESKHVDFLVDSYENGNQPKIIDMSGIRAWKGTLKQLRINPFTTVSSGNFGIDYIKIRNNPVAGPTPSPLPVTITARSYAFEGTNENFTNSASINNVSNVYGTYFGAYCGLDPYIVSPDNQNVDIDSNKIVRLRITNKSTATTGALYWTTTSSPAFDENKKVVISFPKTDQNNLLDNSEIILDMSGIVNWSGTLKQIRLDPNEGHTNTGGFNLAYLKIGKQSWEFNTAGNKEGWTVGSNVSGDTVSGGMYSGNITGSIPYVYSPDNLGISCYDAVKIRVKYRNNSMANKARIYFTTTDDQNWDINKYVEFNVNVQDSLSTEYIVDMSGCGKWVGMLKQLRFDPSENGTGMGTFLIDYIRIDQ